MSERLTASLEDGTLERLRTLAGGERKVGAYLSDVVAWLWDYREALQARPLSGMALVHSEWIMTPEEQQQALERQARIDAQLESMWAQIEEQRAYLEKLGARIDVHGQAIQEARLEAQQQDSSQNDA